MNRGAVPTQAGVVPKQSSDKDSEHLRMLIEAVKDYAIFMLDPAGVVVTWNSGAQALKGYSSDQIIGQHFSVFYSEEDCKSLKPQLELETAERVGRSESEGWRVRQNGTAFWAHVLVSAIRGDAGDLLGFAKVTRDLTERRHTERLEYLEAQRKSQELEDENRRMHEANRLKSEFLANMSHELRTPLNAIIGFSELMFKGKAGPVADEHREYLGDILNSSRHLLKLINDVLDLAKVESGKLEFRPEPLDLRLLIGEVSDILRGLASAKGIHIEAVVDPAVSAVVLDSSKLKQVLYNYLSNALKFSPDFAVVTIRVQPESEGWFRLEVQDRGIGIASEDLHRLFVEFQQLDAGMAKKYAGTGLGLALTKRIVEAQGGSVGVISRSDAGSTFWAVLPRNASNLRVEESARPPAPALERSTTLAGTVLVVDDDPAALRLMGATLKSAGYTARCFGHPAEALRALEDAVPAVVVMDLEMPDMDGFDLLERLRKLPHLRGVPVVVWTVKDVSEAERKRLLVAAQRIVLKGEGGGEAILEALAPYLSTEKAGGVNGA
ncbi:MAG TPA: ATP-binding protein [Polyangiaceae bacterium]|nr:ATP-binding protein [Polyangiaceae bacterium]